MSETVAAPVSRWKPVRAGIRNVWEYDDQVFEFAEGRLVLRGANGSGKSNALALLVPFLFDGIMAASRMDSMGGGRSMKTLLLCLSDDERSARFRHEQRTGYVWLEFVRGEEHLTIGCGARASVQRDAEAWFFVTPMRPGIDLDLTPGGVPLAKSQLADRLGPAAVFESAEAYREAVDRVLFGIGRHRYENLLELLIVLRRPHLAGRLNLEQLSKALSDGLAPLDANLIANVAASFEDLEAVQRDLHNLQAAHRSVQSFLPTYTGYLRATARARALATTDAARAVRAGQRRLARADERLVAVQGQIQLLAEARQATAERREIAEQRHRAVLESPAYREASSLIEVENRAEDAEQGARRATAQGEALKTRAGTAAGELLEAEAEAGHARSHVAREYQRAAVAADEAGVNWSTRPGAIEPAILDRDLKAACAARRQQISEVRDGIEAADRASVEAKGLTEAAGRSEEAAVEADAARDAAASAVDAARDALRDEVAAFVEQSRLPDLEALDEAVTLLAEPGAATLEDTLSALLFARREELSKRDARAADASERAGAARAFAVEERQRVASQTIVSPEALVTRPADRSGRTGAPLYATCDFAASLDEADRAGLEAALEASGLLDSWVGEITGELDAWLEPAGAVAGPCLADVLVPDPPPGSGLGRDEVAAVLASIALADAGIAVLPDGTFHLGPLAGRYAKRDAQFIGATARERHRRHVLEQIDGRIAELDAELASLRARREGIVEEQERLDELSRSLPSSECLREARDSLLKAAAVASSRREQAGEDADRALVARRRADECRARVLQLSSDRRLPSDRAGLEEAEGRLRLYEQSCAELLRAAAVLQERERSEATARAAREEAESMLSLALHEQEEAQLRARGLRARADELRAGLGAEAEAPLRELALIDAELSRLHDEAERVVESSSAAFEEQGAAKAEHEVAGASLTEADQAVAAAAARLEVLRLSDIWAAVSASPGAPPGDDAQLASMLVEATADLGAEPDENALQRGFRVLLDELGRGHEPSLSWIDHVGVVEVTSEAGTFSLLWLASELGAQIDRQEKLLSERDREIFERHLLTRVSEALRELLNDAERLVAGINRSLADRPTASGLSVQLRWELETSDPSVRTAVSLLRKTPELLGSDDREQLRSFFSRAIAQRRSEDAAVGYADVLRAVLDYRSWFVFVPFVRSAAGGSQRLTKTLFRSLSGGEQAVVLHLPLFAAAAAHYDAAPEGPRIIALDEAFAGIDEVMRGELMGLLVRFDLDMLLTGHELWGAYGQVPALMTFDLLRRPPLEGVSAFALRWDGTAMAEA
ncbi:MAG: TIGR02680 family protein [Acidimicrobiales bacterium]